MEANVFPKASFSGTEGYQFRTKLRKSSLRVIGKVSFNDENNDKKSNFSNFRNIKGLIQEEMNRFFGDFSPTTLGHSTEDLTVQLLTGSLMKDIKKVVRMEECFDDWDSLLIC